jgi:serine/threonine protein kinase
MDLFDFCRGERHHQKAERRWPRMHPLCVALDIAKGMEYLHFRGMVHRDLKSMNVMIDLEYVGKIIDFGDVKVRDKKDDVLIRDTFQSTSRIFLKRTPPSCAA